jgi:DNA polymerase-4
MRSVTRSLTLEEPVAATLTLTEIAEQLAWQALRDELRQQAEADQAGAGSGAGSGAESGSGSRSGAEPATADQAEVAHQRPGAGPIGSIQISLLAISVSNLVVRHAVQQELAVAPDDPRREGTESGAARLAVDSSMDAVRAKFGRSAVGYLPARSRDGVPDAFRELAQKEV